MCNSWLYRLCTTFDYSYRLDRRFLWSAIPTCCPGPWMRACSVLGPPFTCLTRSVRRGILYKKSSTKWKPKWFVLEGTSLLYYENITDCHKNPEKPKRRIELVYVDVRMRLGSATMLTWHGLLKYRAQWPCTCPFRKASHACTVRKMPPGKKTPKGTAGFTLSNVRQSHPDFAVTGIHLL